MCLIKSEIALRCVLLLISKVLFGLFGNVETAIQTENIGIPLAGPEVRYATIEELNGSNLRPFRKRAPQVMYKISMDNETFTITLRPNLHLHTPGCLIHRHRMNGGKEIYPCAQEELDCYYIGSSDAHNESWVAANICDGLRGVINIDNRSLFIEPTNLSNRSVTSQGHVHAVYRYQGDKQVCALKDRGFDSNLHVVFGRRKREIKTRYIETRLVVDPIMFHFHKSYSNVMNYTLLAFNVATRLFRDPSIQTDIYLVLSELHVFETFDNFTAALTENANNTLTDFCAWQSSLVTETDCSVLLTRLDIESDEGERGVNGLSRRRGVCRPQHRCAIVEDDGPAMGITLAHEIGHLLGLNHDNPNGDVGIMSNGGWSGNEAFEWSQRSAYELQLSLRKNDLICLDNVPEGFHSSKPIKMLPGLIYSAEQQCQMMFGASASYYQYPPDHPTRLSYDPCPNLICDGRKLSQPLMDGTDCNNTRTWCKHGKCVEIDPDILTVHGVWSAWSDSINPCSRTCGGGVQITRRRKCNNPPPQYGGKDCSGVPTEVKICNIQACTTDYRELQCNVSVSKYLPGRPAQPNLELHDSDSFDVESCIRRCDIGERTYQIDRYNDGTECLTDHLFPFGRCVGGQCRKFGCDGIADSGLEFDDCGICNGTGDSCEKVSRNYNEIGIQNKYRFVAKIPKDSSGVLITQKIRSSFLSIVVAGVRVLNRDGIPSPSAVYNLLGVQIRYMSVPETIQILGKLQQDIIVEVFPRGAQLRSDITYTYYIPKSDQMLYAWGAFNNSECSRPCGNGTRIDEPRCRFSNTTVTDDIRCDILSKPNIKVRVCNTQDCPPSWIPGEWGPCSTNCGIGEQKRFVSCVTTVNGVEKEISATHCKTSDMPSQEQRCLRQECPTWKTGSWSNVLIWEDDPFQCSASCGEGYRHRNVFCVFYSDVSYEVNAEYCNAAMRPADKEICFIDYCYALNGNCVDSDANCERYVQTDSFVCSGAYRDYMKNNCLKTCKYCLNGKSTDTENCKLVDPSLGACSNPLYKTWMRQNCPETCGICQDIMDCAVFDMKYCQDPNYNDYMSKHCARSCELCSVKQSR